MSIKITLLLAAAVAALSGIPLTQAAEGDASVPKAAEQQAALDSQPMKQTKVRKVKPHDHASFHKSGVENQPAAQPDQASRTPQAPAHDHQKVHK